VIKRKILTAAIVAVAAFVSLEHASVAQMTQTSPATPDQPMTAPSGTMTAPSGTTTTPSDSTAPSSGTTTTPTQTSLSPVDKQFMIQAAQGGMAEVKMAQLALQKASNERVKDFASQMIAQHTPVNNQLMQLAAQKNVTLPTSIGAKNQATYNQLSKLSGTNFDRSYMSQAGVKGHTQQSAVFQREIQRGQDPEVKNFASQVLPTVQDHLQIARSIVSGTSAAGNMNMNNTMNQQNQPMPQSTASPSSSQ